MAEIMTTTDSADAPDVLSLSDRQDADYATECLPSNPAARTTFRSPSAMASRASCSGPGGAKHHPALGDITFEVGFVVTAIVYLLLRPFGAARRKPA